ncbi:MAG: lipase maturation factor family protein [Candidatus Paceibacteria bacterium]
MTRAIKDFFVKKLQINEDGKYNFSIYIFKRALAVIYFIAFLSFLFQAEGLIGSSGILPAVEYFKLIKSKLGLFQALVFKPSIFLFFTSDFVIKLVPTLGVIFSVILFFNIHERIVLFILYILYLSITVGGQQFMAFQWDSLLLEAGFLAIFLQYNSSLAVWLFRWLLFRLMFGSGISKLMSGDSLWWNLTALKHHHLTQPLPTFLAWYFDKMPLWFHKLSTGFVLAIELIVPFFYFLQNKFRAAAGVITVILMALISLTGNYTLFTFLTASLVLFLINNFQWSRLIKPLWIQKVLNRIKRHSSNLKAYLAPVVGSLIFLFSLLLFSRQLQINPIDVISLLRPVQSYRIVNTYGLFANMTHPRYEIIIQGSRNGKNWKNYDFKYKPGELSEPPTWVQPHQPRLDWQMWFASLSSFERQVWFQRFIIKLMQNSPPVVDLLEKNPFPIHPPQYIRAVKYKYEFTDFNSTKWWKRERVGIYLPTVSKKRLLKLN